MTLFLSLLDVNVDERAKVLKQAIRGTKSRQFEVNHAVFTQMPGTPFAYWASNKIRDIFKTHPPYEANGRSVRQGLATADDFRFVRAWWEVTSLDIGSRWFGFAKGGSFSPFYADVHLTVNWAQDGAEIKNNLNERGEIRSNVWMLRDTAPNFFFRPGLTWPLRSRRFAPQPLAAGNIFSVRGYCAFAPAPELTSTLALFNSSAFDFIFKTTLGRFGYPEFIVGVLQRLPWAEASRDQKERLTTLGHDSWCLKRKLDTVNETSHAFMLPAALRTRLGPFQPLAIREELAEIQDSIDDLAFVVYGLDRDERAAIESWASQATHADKEFYSEEEKEEKEEESENESDKVAGAESADTSTDLHSWAIGVIFGRFDIRLATGERQAPPDPGPFDPLPARSPGMIPEADEAQFPAHPLLVDDPGHALDLTSQAADVLERVGFALENPGTFRRWLARDFFPLHIRMYSKSRRKAPIYWQLATPSASYSVWLYIHAFNRDTLYQVQEIAGMKLLHEERQLESLRARVSPSSTAAERKELAARELFIEELRAFLDEVKRVAPLWNPNLDDGVIINFAPLWRLVPHHKSWQKELKATWDALCAGEYDWAHLAMHLWPDRVVPQCATDRSLAIAHGLEEVFWVEGADGKWKPRPEPTRPIEELVRDRTSPAVKAALKSLLESPVSPAGNGRGRPRRGRRAAGAPA